MCALVSNAFNPTYELLYKRNKEAQIFTAEPRRIAESAEF
jgi:hypothetical protein